MNKAEMESFGQVIGQRMKALTEDIESRLKAIEDSHLPASRFNDLRLVVSDQVNALEKRLDELPEPVNGKDGEDRPIVEPLNLLDGNAYEKHTAGWFDNSLWISIRDARDTPANDPTAWKCVLEGFKSGYATYNGEHSYTLTLKGGNGQQLDIDMQIPYPVHKGIYEDGATYAEGDWITKGSAMFMALADTDEPPPGAGWRQIFTAKRGEKGLPGKQGEKGDKGEQGEPGKAGPRGKGLTEAEIQEARELILELKDIAEVFRGEP